MAKKIVFLIAFVFSGFVHAENISFQFDKAKLSDVVNYVVRSVLKSDFVIARDVPLDQEVTFKLTNVDKSNVLPTFKRLLNSFDVDIVESGGVLTVSRLVRGSVPEVVQGNSGLVPSDNPQSLSDLERLSRDPLPVQGGDVRIYFPKYRSVDYLSVLVRLAGGRLFDSGVMSAPVFYPVAQNQLHNQPVGVVNSFSQLQQHNQLQNNSLQPVNAVSKVNDVLIFSASEAVYQKVLPLLEKVDIAPVVVQIKAVVLELTTGDDSQRSINVIANLLNSKFGIVFDAGALAKNQVSVKLPNLQAVLSAVDGDNRFRYLSEPYMRVVDGESAKLTVGQEVPTRGAVVQNSTGQNIQSIEYRTAGLMLEVVPRVYAESVQLKINQEISSFTTTNTSGIDSPTILKRQASSVVRLSDGELFILGGLDEERDTASRSGLSFLPDFLSARSSNKSKSQILIIMELQRLKPDSALLNL